MSMAKVALVGICQRYEVSLLYLFGSRLHTALQILDGHAPTVDDPLADIDVGVVFSAPLPMGRQRAQLYSALFNELEDIFLPYAVDLVFLEENHSVFQAEAVIGSCVYAATPEIKDAYEASVLCRACDFRPFLAKYYQELLEVR